MVVLGLVGFNLYKNGMVIFTPQIKFSPTPTNQVPTDSTESWETYTDNIEKYSFSYPSSWRFYPGNPNTLYSYAENETRNGHFNPELDKNKIKIEISTTSKLYNSLEEIVREDEEEASELRDTKVKRQYEEILIDRQRALKTITDSSLSVGEDKIVLIYVKNPFTKHILSFVAMPRYDINKEVIDQILSTFRFME